MSRARRKKQIRNRIIAFVMAVAMVFTVVKVNSGKSIVKAGEGKETTDGVDGAYIKLDCYDGVLGYFQIKNHPNKDGLVEIGAAANLLYDQLVNNTGTYTAPVYTIYTQNDSVEFKLPVISPGNYSAPYIYALPTEGVPNSEKDSYLLDNTYEGYPIYKRYLYYWVNKSDSENLNSSNNQADLYVKLMYDSTQVPMVGDVNGPNDDEERNAFIKGLNDKCDLFNGSNDSGQKDKGQKVLTLKYEKKADPGFEISDKGVITDNWDNSEPQDNEYYYGHNEFVISDSSLDGSDDDKVAARQGNESKTSTYINNDINNYFPSDGTYYIYHRYITEKVETTDETNSAVYYTDSTGKQVSINRRLISTVDYWNGNTKPEDTEKIIRLFEGDIPDDTTYETINAEPGEILTFSATIDETGEFVVQKGTKDPETGEISYAGYGSFVLNSENQFTNSCSLPSGPNGTEDYYKFILRNGNETAKLAHTIELTVKSKDYSLDIGEVKADGKSVSSYTSTSPLLTNKQNISISAKINAGSDVKDLSVKINDSSSFEGKPLEKDESGDYTINYGLEDGINDLRIEATGTKGENGEQVLDSLDDHFFVHYDATAPLIQEVQNKQSEDSVTIASSEKNLVIEIKLQDNANGVGLDDTDLGSVEVAEIKQTIDGEEVNKKYSINKVTDQDGLYRVVIPSEDLKPVFAKGGTLNYTILAVDKLGNGTNSESERANGTVTFADESIDIKAIPIFSVFETNPEWVPENQNYSNYNNDSNKPGDAKVGFRIEVTSAVLLDRIDVTESIGAITTTVYTSDTSVSGAKPLPDHSLDETTNKFLYIIETRTMNVSSGRYTVTVSATNENGHSETTGTEIYIVDIDGPEIDLKANAGAVSAPIDEDDNTDWNKEVYITLTVADKPDSDNAGIDIASIFNDTTRENVIKVEGAKFDSDKSVNSTTDPVIVYKVNDSAAPDDSGTNGVTHVSIKVYDRLGNVSEGSADYKVDGEKPEIVFGSKSTPVTETYFNGNGQLNITADVSDNYCIETVTFKVTAAPDTDGVSEIIKTITRNTPQPSTTDLSKTCEVTLSELLPNEYEVKAGTYTITATATDSAGNTTTNTLDIIVDTVIPEVFVSNVSGTASENNPKSLSYIGPEGSHFGTTERKVNYDGYYRVKGSESETGNAESVVIEFKAFDLNFAEDGSWLIVQDKANGAESFSPVSADNITITPVLDGENPTGEYTVSVTINVEGSHEVRALVTDKTGFNSVYSKTVEFTIDKTDPVVTLKLNDGTDYSDYYKGSVICTLDIVETNENDDAESVTCEFIPAGKTETDKSTTTVDYKNYDADNPLTFENDGSYKIYATVVDKSGRSITTKAVEFIIDKTAPLADIDVKSNDPNLSSAPKTTGTATTAVTYKHSSGLEAGNYYYYPMTKGSVRVGFSVNDINIYGDGIVITHSIDGVADTGFHVDLTPTIDELTSVSNTSLIEAEGKHTFTISATDKAGNPTAATKTVEFVIDKTAPDLSIYFDGQPATAGLRKNGTVTVTPHHEVEKNWDAKDVTLTYVYTPAGGSAQAAQTINEFTTATFPLDGQGDGKYDITIVAIDLAGNSTTKTSSFVIDKAAPQLSITKVDGTAPKLGDYSRPYEESYKGGTVKYDYAQVYGSTNVKVTIDVFDYDIDKTKAGTFKVYDNGKEVAATFSDKATNEYTGTVTISGEGKHTITAEATDITGHTGETTGVTFIIDNTDPTLSIQVNDEDPVAMTRYDGNVKISYDLEDANIDENDINVIYTFTPAGGANQGEKTEAIGLGKTRTFTENGTYEVTIKAVDKAGKYKSASTSFVIDKAKPEIDLKITTSKPAKFDKYKRTYKPAVEGYFTAAKDGYEYGQYYKENVKIQISVFDYDAKWTAVYDNDELVDVEFKYQGGGLYTADFTISGEGSHVIKAESEDKSGNRGESSELSFIIDKTAPDLTTTLNSEKYSDMDAFLSKDAVVGISVEDDNEDADDIYRVSVTALSDGSDTIEAKDYVKEGQETYKKNAYYTVTYTVIDRAGNSSTAKVGFTIDTTRPQSDIKITTKDPAKIAKYNNKYSNTNGHFNTEYTYGQYYNETVAMDMAVFDYNADKIVVTDNDEVIPVTFVKRGNERVASSITISGEGEHVVKITVTDKSGNDASNTVGFTIDRTAPSLSATLNGSGNITDQYLPADASVYLSVSDTNEDEDDVTRVVKLTRPSASAENTTETGALEGTIGYSTEADYEITYTAIDRAGNESSPVTYTFRVDKTAPQLSITGITRDATSPENVTITYSMIEDFYWDVNSAEVKIYKKVDGASESLLKTVDFKASGANSSMSDLFEEDGEYRFEFTAEDKTGNQANENFRFILDKNAPIITLSGVDGYLTDENVTFGVKVDETFYLGNNVKLEGTRKTIDEPDGKPIEFDDYTRLTRSSSANFEQIFTEDGIYNIKVTSKDAAGNETVQNVQFTIDKTDPLIKDLEELADEEDYEIYQAAVSSGDTDAKKALIPIFNEFNFDYDADDIVTDLTTVTYKLYMDGVLYDGLSEVADGFHELRITAEDEVGNTAERTFYFILDTVKPGIIVTGVEEGDNLMDPTTITVSLQLTEDTLKSVKLNGNPVAISGNTASFEVSEKGDYELVIEAVDDAGNESTMTLRFEYGRTSSWLWWLIGGGAALIIAATIFFILLGKKRKKDEK